ncbi:hypothetical protein [Mesorhizobium sp. ANAO-SY3R2]|uniref:hypothetical protein n=1 Tax=Mesorhizobium sp. ANAO-SY3R2 TaxID=3166644 RepID=UPI00366C208F
MFGFFDWIKMGAAGALVLMAALAFDRWIDDPLVFAAGKDAGAITERQAWEEARRRLEAKRAEDKRIAQAKIDAAERAYFRERIGDVVRMTALDQEIRKAAADGSTACSDGSSAPPAFTRGVSRALNAIGRRGPVAGGDAAVGQATVR